MATPRTYTYQQLDDSYGGIPCKKTLVARDDFDSGWVPTDTVDVLTYMEAMYDRDDGYNTCISASRALSNTERRNFINWALDKIIEYTPDGYSRKAAMITLKNDLVDYVTTPTAPKKAALLSTAYAIAPVTSQDAEILVANAFKGITIAIANNTVTPTVMEHFTNSLMKAGVKLSGASTDTVVRAVLTKLEQVLGLIDP